MAFDAKKIMEEVQERVDSVQLLEPGLSLALSIVAVELGLGKFSYVIEHPADESHGDFATNFALAAMGGEGVKERFGNPRALAQEVVKKMEGRFQIDEKYEKPEIAGPGFINFKIKDGWLIRQLDYVIEQGDNYGRGLWGRDRRMVIDYSAPNIAKRFGVGHLRSTIIGQAIYNLYKYSGWRVTGDNHLGDWGTQFGMIIAAVEEKGVSMDDMGVNDLEQIYVEFNKRIEEAPELKDKAREAFARLEKGEESARKIWKRAVEISMEEFERIYDWLGVKIEKTYGESFYENIMPNVIEEIKAKGLCRESEGAVIVEFETMPPAILVKSNGTTTYFTRDLATIWYRLFGDDEEIKAKLYVYEVGAEQTLHFRQVFETVKALGWAKDVDFVHVAHGRMSLPEGKMSTRKGNTIKLEDLIGQSIAKAAELQEEKHDDISEIIGIGAVKYNELKRAPQTNYVFRWDEALNMQGDSGPYMQYTYARAKSVLRKAGEIADHKQADLNDEEKTLIRWLVRFPEEVESAARDFSPNYLPNYLFELSSRYNSFYNKHKIIGGDNEMVRLKLTEAVTITVKNGLAIMGIEAPEKM